MNGSGVRKVSLPIVTWCSCITSSRADWTLAGARLISSASSRLVKTGPSSVVKLACLGSKTRVPMRSAGTRSGVNWTRPKLAPTTWARALTVAVLAMPGTPSISTCPCASRPTSRRSTSLSWTTIRRLISNRTCSSGVPAPGTTESGGFSASVMHMCLFGFSGGEGTFAEGDGDRAGRAVGEPVGDRHLVSGLVGGERLADAVAVGDAVAADGGDHPAGLDAGLVGGPAADDADHVGAAGRVIARLDAEVGAAGVRHGAVGDQLLGDADDLVAGDREADPSRRLAALLGVGSGESRDPDDLSGDVDQRAAGVARVDRRRGLDEVGQGDAVALRLGAAGGTDDALGNGVAEAEGTADGEHHVPHLDLGGVAEVGRRELGVGTAQLEHGEVALGEAAEQAGGEGVA